MKVPAVEVARVAAGATSGTVVRAALADAVALLFARDAALRAGDDSEDVHQARVATRRIRSHLHTFRPVVDRVWADELRVELSWLAALLGGVRDADVLGSRLAGRGEALPRADRRYLQELLTRLSEERDEAWGRLRVAMGSNRYDDLASQLLSAVEHPPLRPRAAEPARTLLAARVRREWRRLDATVADLEAHPRDRNLHEVRIFTKRVRYAVEVCVPVWGKRPRRLAKALARVQSVLGDLQDAVVAEAWLRERAGGRSSHRSFVAGELAMLEQEAARASREAWYPTWERAADRTLRSWLG